MIAAALKEVAHMVIVQMIERMFPFLAKLYELQMAQQTQLVRHS